MDKNQPFFDPYNFNVQSQVTTQPMMDSSFETMNNPMMYYEQQYVYYKYLTQVLEYKIKLKELEKLNIEKNNGKV